MPIEVEVTWPKRHRGRHQKPRKGKDIAMTCNHTFAVDAGCEHCGIILSELVESQQVEIEELKNYVRMFAAQCNILEEVLRENGIEDGIKTHKEATNELRERQRRNR